MLPTLAHISTHSQKDILILMTTLLEKFNLDSELFSTVVDSPELFETSGTTTMLRAGKRVPYSASINGVSIPAYVTLQSARLTRLSLLKQEQRSTGNEYNLVTGILKPVQMDVELVIDGESISLIDLLHHFAQQASGKEIAREEFVHTARRIGLNFADGMPLFFQQFGASEAGFNNAIELFKAAGAQDVRGNMKNPGRIVQAWQHPGDGIEITAFELGTVDRTKSSRFKHDGVGQGFLNLVEAQIEQFTRIVSLRRGVRVLKTELENNTSTLSQADVKKLNEAIESQRAMSRQWASNWAGAQKRLVMLKNGSFEEQDMYDPVNAPCGRFTLTVDNSPVEIDLWTNSATANNSSSQTTASVADDDDDDAPF